MLASWKLTVGTLLPVLVTNQSRARAIAGITVHTARTGLARYCFGTHVITANGHCHPTWLSGFETDDYSDRFW
jgi:hypothetical protein